ncbi:uncharacterized protein [Melopsittacus undulatus]|uniref:uncharacterized protein n=1 Tax=Melopsittacus undulatus TaxID=13146 RepID=UPI00146B3999|nr:uncharacterized protein LOC115945639 [Melopsittacus undulatus]XP_030900420.2 uncharacterized protein LOC115945639 [Melopsittacus undulatus]
MWKIIVLMNFYLLGVQGKSLEQEAYVEQMRGLLGYPVTLQINITKAQNPQTIQFDACQVLKCGDLKEQRKLSSHDKYLCPEYYLQPYWGPPCPGWSDVWFTTAFNGWVSPNARGKSLKSKIAMFKGHINPDCKDLECNPIILTITNADGEVSQTYGLGADVPGKDPLARLRIVVWEPKRNERTQTTDTTIPPLVEGSPPNNPKVEKGKDLKRTSETEAGYGDTNTRVELVKYRVKSLNRSNCDACASGRPTAQVVPFPLGWSKDAQGMRCMIALYQERTAWGNEACKSLSLLFPALRKKDIRVPPTFSSAAGNHTACLSRKGASATKDLGQLEMCTELLNVAEEETGNYSALSIPRADLWWYCGGRVLRPTLPPNWRGTCAIVQLAIPFTLAFEKGTAS